MNGTDAYLEGQARRVDNCREAVVELIRDMEPENAGRLEMALDSYLAVAFTYILAKAGLDCAARLEEKQPSEYIAGLFVGAFIMALTAILAILGWTVPAIIAGIVGLLASVLLGLMALS